MLTLGIHDGHTATACLFENGKVLACISEERLNREKGFNGFPALSIKKCLEISGKTMDEIEAVGFCSIMPQIGDFHYHKPHFHKRAFGNLARVMPKSLLQSPKNIKRSQKLGEWLFPGRLKGLMNQLKEIGVKTDKVHFYEHHQLHAATSYYTNWYKNDETLVITLDGSGDAVCATVNIGKNGKLDRIAEVFNYNSICDFYTRVTQYLGMKPMSHEYKVMGMAPYADKWGQKKVMEIFKNYFKVSEKDPLQFLNTSGYWKWQFNQAFQEVLAEKRFDWITGAVQELFIEVTLQWIKNAIKHTGIKHLALSGGGFMNVKLNYLVSQLKEVESLFIFPGCGDESNPVGAAILASIDNGFDYQKIESLGMIYWGPSYSNEQIENAIRQELDPSNFNIFKSNNVNKDVAKKIAEGKIIGRFTGRMEWGARSLGNRSIVADPRNQATIHKINKAIKMRDFWMPFAPAILQDYRETYLILRSDYKSPFMTIAPDTKEAAWGDLSAGLHPFDRSTRAQILDPINHPSFYELVSEFEKITGVGGVLNTSFNLHGDAVVCTPDDAIYTFLNSGLDVLQMEDYIVEKKSSWNRESEKAKHLHELEAVNN